MHNILKVKTLDNGQNTDKALTDATEELSKQVEAAQDEGWECSGGIQIYSRPGGRGTVVYLMQGMTMRPPLVNIPKPTIAELQAIIDSTPSGSVAIMPDGQVTITDTPKRGPGRPPKAKADGKEEVTA